MSELKIEINEIDLANLFGVNNSHFEAIKLKFPKLKLIARGNQIKAVGSDDELKISHQLEVSGLAAATNYTCVMTASPEGLIQEISISTLSDAATTPPQILNLRTKFAVQILNKFVRFICENNFGIFGVFIFKFHHLSLLIHWQYLGIP